MNLLLWIAKNNMTEDAFVKLAKIGKSSYYQYKRTHTIPSVLSAVRISEATNGEVSVQDILSKKAFKKEF